MKTTVDRLISRFSVKTTAVVTLACFVWSSVLSQAVYGAVSVPDPLQVRAKTALEEFILPYSLGRVTGAYRGGSGKAAILIQDLHCHPGTQRNIAGILGLLGRRYAISRIYIEGGVGPLDTSWINKIDTPRFREEMLEGFLDAGRLTGSEYYSIKSGKYTLLEGLEDGPLYFDNLKRLDAIRNGRGGLQEKLSAVERAFAGLKNQYYSSANRRFDNLLARHAADAVRGETYYRLLVKTARKAGVPLAWYPELRRHTRILAMQKRLDHGKVGRQMARYLSALRGNIPHQTYADLLTLARDPSRMSELYVRLEGLAREQGQPLPGGSKQLNQFFNYVEANQTLNPLALAREEKELVREIQNRFSLTVAEQEITFLSGFFVCVKDYLESRISADDYGYLVKNMPAFRRTWNKYADGNIISALADSFDILDRFYAANLARNDIFFEKSFGALPLSAPCPGRGETSQNEVLILLENTKDVKVLVTGGFHTRGMEELCRRHGVSYLVITPSIAGAVEPARRNYDRIMAEQAGELDGQALAAYCLTNKIEREELEIKLEAARIPADQRARWIEAVFNEALREEFLKEKIAGDYQSFDGSDEEFAQAVKNGMAALGIPAATVTMANHKLTVTSDISVTVPLSHGGRPDPGRHGIKLYSFAAPLLFVPLLASGIAFDPVVIFAGISVALLLAAGIPAVLAAHRRGQRHSGAHIGRWLLGIGVAVALSLASWSMPAQPTPPADTTVAVQAERPPHQIGRDEQQDTAVSDYVPPKEPPIVDKVYPAIAVQAKSDAFSSFESSWKTLGFVIERQFIGVETQLNEAIADIVYSGSRLKDSVVNADKYQAEAEEMVAWLDNDDNKDWRQQSAVKDLAGIPYNETAVKALIGVVDGKYGGDAELQALAKDALVEIGDRVMKPLEQAVAAAREEGRDCAALEETLAMMRERIKLVAEIKLRYGITVRDYQGTRFSVEQLWAVKTFLGVFELPNDVSIVEAFRPGEAHWAGRYKGGNGLGSGIVYYDITAQNDDLSQFYRLQFHEATHSVDLAEYYWKAFDKLYGESSTVVESSRWLKTYADYAERYGATNAHEDFATTVENYALSTPGTFLNALASAERGRPLYLEKLVFVADMFSQQHPDHTVFYTIAGEDSDVALCYLEVPVTRDGNGLKTIGDVAIYNSDGSYNIAGLRTYFESVKIDRPGPVLRPFSLDRGSGFVMPPFMVMGCLIPLMIGMARRGRAASRRASSRKGRDKDNGAVDVPALIEDAASRAATLGLKPRTTAEEAAAVISQDWFGLACPAGKYAPEILKYRVGLVPSDGEGYPDALRRGETLAAAGFDVVLPVVCPETGSRREIRTFDSGGSLTIIEAAMTSEEMLTAAAEGRAWDSGETLDPKDVRPFSLILWTDRAQMKADLNPNASGKSGVVPVNICIDENIRLSRADRLFRIRNTRPMPGDAATYYYAAPADRNGLSSLTEDFLRATVAPVARTLVVDLAAAGFDVRSRDFRNSARKIIEAGQRAGIAVAFGVTDGQFRSMPSGLKRFIAARGAGFELILGGEQGKALNVAINRFRAALDSLRIPTDRTSAQLPAAALADSALTDRIHAQGLRVSAKRALGDHAAAGDEDILYLDGDRETLERMSAQDLQNLLDNLNPRHGLGMTDRLNRVLALAGYGVPAGDTEGDPLARLRGKIAAFIDRHEFSRGYSAGFADGAKMGPAAAAELADWVKVLRGADVSNPRARELAGYQRGCLEAQLARFHFNYLADSALAARLTADLAVEYGQALDLETVSTHEAFARRIDRVLEGWPAAAAHPRFNETVTSIRELRNNPELFARVPGPALTALKELLSSGVLDNRPEKPAAIAALVCLLKLYGDRDMRDAFDALSRDAFTAMLEGARATLRAA